jgi:hypothetical protein
VRSVSGYHAGVSDINGSDVNEQAKRVAGWLLWLLVAVIVVVALVGLLLLGPFGLAVAIPVAILAFIIFGSSSSGAAGGA